MYYILNEGCTWDDSSDAISYATAISGTIRVSKLLLLPYTFCYFNPLH